jgi:phospholipid transport system substrate-binding protein
MMRKLCLVFLFVALANAPAQACEASAFITNAGNAFLGAARSHSASAFSGVAARYTDLNGIAMFALGPNRKLLSKSQETQYLSLTRSFIGRFMARNSGSLTGGNLKVVDCSGPNTAMTVNTQLSNGKKVVFKVYKTRRGYLVRDVNVSSVWLAQQLRSNFTGVIRRNNGRISALFEYLGS